MKVFVRRLDDVPRIVQTLAHEKSRLFPEYVLLEDANEVTADGPSRVMLTDSPVLFKILSDHSSPERERLCRSLQQVTEAIGSRGLIFSSPEEVVKLAQGIEMVRTQDVQPLSVETWAEKIALELQQRGPEVD